MTTRRATGRRALALTVAGAGVIHLALGPEHTAEWSVLGFGFFASGVLQLAWAAALGLGESRVVTALGALASLAFIMMWVVSRTSGLPLGPEAFVPESIGVADAVCVALEVVAVLGAVVLLRRPHLGSHPTPRLLARALVAGAAALVVGSTGVAVATAGHGHETGTPCTTPLVTTGVDSHHTGADRGLAAFGCPMLDDHNSHVEPKIG